MEIPAHVHQADAMPIGCDMSWEWERSHYYFAIIASYSKWFIPGKKTIFDDSQCSKRFLALENHFKILLEKKGVKEKMMINIHRNPLFQQFLLQSTIFVDPKIYGRVAL